MSVTSTSKYCRHTTACANDCTRSHLLDGPITIEDSDDDEVQVIRHTRQHTPASPASVGSRQSPVDLTEDDVPATLPMPPLVRQDNREVVQEVVQEIAAPVVIPEAVQEVAPPVRVDVQAVEQEVAQPAAQPVALLNNIKKVQPRSFKKIMQEVPRRSTRLAQKSSKACLCE